MKEFKLDIVDAMLEILLDLVCSWKICLLDCLDINVEERVVTFEVDRGKDLEDNNNITSSTNTSTGRWIRDYNHQPNNR